MKTRITFVSAVALGVMSFMASCSNEAMDSATDGVMLEAEVSGIANTRAAVEGTTLPDGSNYGLYVYQNYQIVADNVKMTPASTATGYMITGNNEVKVAAYYPYSEKAVEYEDAVTIYPGSTDYLHTVSSGTYTKSNSKASIQLHHALARVKFNVTVAKDAKSSYKVSLWGMENVYDKGAMRLGIVGDEVYGYTDSKGTVKFDNPISDEIKASTTVSTEVFLLPQNLKDMSPYVFFSIDGESQGISQDIIDATTSGKWESGKVYTYNITISEGAKLSVTAATIEEWGSVEEKNEITVELFDRTNGHEYVDLGLPSGTLWATCNVGANSPEEYGDYFAWGETKARDNFTEENYSYSVKTEILPLEDDAAYVNWGKEWRMPTYAELEELRNECTWKSTTLNGKMGTKISSKKNENYIFLPWAGMYTYASWSGTSFSDGNERGFYWSSQLYKDTMPWHIGLDLSSYIEPQNAYNGLTVRPVLNK